MSFEIPANNASNLILDVATMTGNSKIDELSDLDGPWTIPLLTDYSNPKSIVTFLKIK